MRKIETLFIYTGLILAISATGALIWNVPRNRAGGIYHFPESRYGAFLAAQHAIAINDFDAAADFSNALSGVDYAVVQNTRMMSEFLTGRLPADMELLKSEKAIASRLMYDAYLIGQGDWEELYSRHKKDESALAAPLRIWSGIASNYKTKTFEFINSLPTNESWKSFVRGQVYAETGDLTKAAEHFALVSPDFMNINDYLYIMSFYNHNNMQDAANELRTEFTSRPGGMFMLEYDFVPDWSVYSGYKNALAFSLIQNVSHTHIMMYSDLAILLLRFAQIIAPTAEYDADAVNYYIGQFFYTNGGDYKKYFAMIPQTSPFYPFAELKVVERDGDINAISRALRSNPLFVPGVNKMVAYHVSHGNRRAALRVVNRALKSSQISDISHAFLLKVRAHIYFMFGDFNKAQSDLHAAADILVADTDILSMQAKIWAAQNREIETAYQYAMTLVKRDPTDIAAWDTLGAVVATREGADTALELLMRVGEISATNSGLYERLGDLYMVSGDKNAARAAYSRALDLSDDGLIIIPSVKRKLRKIK